MMKTFSCVLFPDENSKKKIRKLSEEISAESNSTNSLSFPPHISIMGDFQVEDNNIDNLCSSLKKFCNESKQIFLKTSIIGTYPWKIIYLDVQETPELVDFHYNCLDIIQKYRTSWIPEKLRLATHFPKEQMDVILTYGYQFAREYFSPHFTLAGNDMEDEIFKMMQKKYEGKEIELDIHFMSLVLFDRDNGNKVFKKFDLG